MDLLLIVLALGTGRATIHLYRRAAPLSAPLGRRIEGGHA